MARTRPGLYPGIQKSSSIPACHSRRRDSVPHADILVVDDGSADNTAAVARAAGVMVVRHPINLCIGGTMQTGRMKFALRNDYNLVLRLDGDGQHDSAGIAPPYTLLWLRSRPTLFWFPFPCSRNQKCVFRSVGASASRPSPDSFR